MDSGMKRRDVLGFAVASTGAALTGLPAFAAETGAVDDSRLPPVWSVDYTLRDYEVVDYDNYSLDSMPRIRFRGPRFDPRAARPGSFFTAFGSAHTLGTLSTVAYPDVLARKLGVPGWNVGVGGNSAFFYNANPAIIEYANRGKFAILQIMSGRMEGNDRIKTLRAAQVALDTRRGDIVGPETIWGRIAQEEPENMDKYVQQSRASWAEQHRKLLAAIKVPTILFWFSARPMSAGGETTRQIGSLDATSFPQLVDGSDVARIGAPADRFVQCTSTRNSGYLLRSRFTGEPVRINHRMLGDRAGPVDLFDERNTYYPSPEMQEDAAAALLPLARKLAGRR